MAILLVNVGLPCYNNIVISTIEMKEYMLPHLRPISFQMLAFYLVYVYWKPMGWNPNFFFLEAQQ
jgi:hypothetical protein